MPISFEVARTVPRGVDAVGVAVPASGAVPRALGLSRVQLAALGFEGKVGQALVLPGEGTIRVALGVGEPASMGPAELRRAGAALARAVPKLAWVATGVADTPGVDARTAAQAVAEGLVLGSYRYGALKREPSASALARVTITGPDAAALQAGAERGALVAEAVCLARDLANTPPGHLTARDLADRAVAIGEAAGLQVEVFDEEAIAELRLGGLIGVNKGSDEPARLVRITYTPRAAVGSVALVGKGVMYDSGGISLKPNDAMHALMKMDMTGAAVVLATMSVLPVVRPRVKVVGYLACTDNMPSGRALKLGDVLTVRNGTTVEVHNTDAEGRLILADALCLAVEDGVDAIVDIATLTGAVQNALGLKVAGVMGNVQPWVDQVKAAAARADESVWQLPLPAEYRKLIDSDVADLKNVGGPYAGALIAGLFLQEFVAGTPWAHLDIAGTMRSESDEGWLSKGATAFGVRTLVELLAAYRPPAEQPPAVRRRARAAARG